MTFLKKLGKYLAEGIALITGLYPLVSSLFGSSDVKEYAGAAVNDLTAIGQVVVQAEALIQAPGSGPQKLAAAAPLVANIIKTSELLAGKKIANETLFMSAATAITSAMADILNSLDSGAVKSSGNPLPVALPTPTLVTMPTASIHVVPPTETLAGANATMAPTENTDAERDPEAPPITTGPPTAHPRGL